MARRAAAMLTLVGCSKWLGVVPTQTKDGVGVARACDEAQRRRSGGHLSVLVRIPKSSAADSCHARMSPGHTWGGEAKRRFEQCSYWLEVMQVSQSLTLH